MRARPPLHDSTPQAPPDPPFGEASSAVKGPIEAYLLPLYRSRWVVVAMLFLGTVGGLAAGVLQPNRYSSVGKMLIRVGERERIPPDTFGDTAGGGGSGTVLTDEMHLLGNEAIYKRVAQRVGPKRILAPPDPASRYDAGVSPAARWLHSLQSWYFRGRDRAHECPEDPCPVCLFEAQQALMDPKRTEISTAPRSNVFIIRHTATDDEVAKLVVDALIAEFDLRHQEIYTARGAVQLLKKRQEDVLREAKETDHELIRIKEELGISDLTTERQKLLDAKYELDREIAAVDLDIKLEERELARIETQLAEIVPATEPVRRMIWEANPAYSKQQQIVDDLHRKRGELLITFTADARPVKNLETDIAREEAKLAEIMPFVRVESFSAPADDDHALFKKLAADSRAELSALVTRKTDKDALRTSITERLRFLRDSEPQIAELQMRSQILRKSAEEATAALESKRALVTLDEAQISNLLVLDWGTNPEKSGPDRKKLLLLGAFAGVVAGLGLAFLRSTLDARVHNAIELERAAGIPVLAAVRRARGLPGRKGTR